jgi:hypothetical protein
MYLWCYHITPELLLNKLMVLANTLISIVSRVLSNNTYIDEIHTGATGKDPGANGHLHGVFKCHLLALEIACLKA